MSDDFIDERWTALLDAVRGVRSTSENLRPRTEDALRAATRNWTIATTRRASQETAYGRHRAQLERLEVEIVGLRAAMETRAVIEQAKGMIMLRDHCDADTAFRTLVRASQASHHKLREVATMMVQWGSTGGAPVLPGGRQREHDARSDRGSESGAAATGEPGHQRRHGSGPAVNAGHDARRGQPARSRAAARG